MTPVWIVLLSLGSPPLSVSSPQRLEFDAYEPIELRADIEIPDGFVVAMYDWKIDRPGRGREYDGGRTFAVWGAPGLYEVELEATLINWEAKQFQKIERVFTLAVQGANPPPRPNDPIDPVTPETSGTVYAITLREAARLNADQSQALLEITHWADQQDGKVSHLQFPPDAENADGSVNETAAKYYEQIPVGSFFPYTFLVQKDASGTSVVKWQGELKGSAELIERIEGLVQ